MKNSPCTWCNDTSSKIDSIEYENEQLKQQNKELTAQNARLHGALEKMKSFYTLTDKEITEILKETPAQSLAAIQYEAIRNAISKFQSIDDSQDVVIKYLYDKAEQLKKGK